MEKEFIRVRSVSDLITVILLIASGTLLIALLSSPAVNITGTFLIFTGILLAAILKSDYKDTETGELYRKKERYFQHAMNAPILSALASKPDSINLEEEDKGNAVRLDIYYNKSGKAYLQLFEYVPYRYEPCSKVYQYDISKIQKLIK